MASMLVDYIVRLVEVTFNGDTRLGRDTPAAAAYGNHVTGQLTRGVDTSASPHTGGTCGDEKPEA
jgi:hypothetical protein